METFNLTLCYDGACGRVIMPLVAGVFFAVWASCLVGAVCVRIDQMTRTKIKSTRAPPTTTPPVSDLPDVPERTVTPPPPSVVAAIKRKPGRPKGSKNKPKL